MIRIKGFHPLLQQWKDIIRHPRRTNSHATLPAAGSFKGNTAYAVIYKFLQQLYDRATIDDPGEALDIMCAYLKGRGIDFD